MASHNVNCIQLSGELPLEFGQWSTIIALSPHSDDVAFSLAATMHELIRSGKDVNLVTCFSVSRYSRHMIGQDVRTITAARISEDLLYASLLGPRCFTSWLGFPDADVRGMRFHEIFDNRPLGNMELITTAEIAQALNARFSLDTLILAPLGVGAHWDHRIIRHLAVDLVRLGFGPVAFYEEIPYRLKSSDEQVAAIIKELPFHDRVVKYRLLFDDVCERKREASRCYTSQVSPSEADAMLDLDRKYRRICAFEYLWFCR